MRSLLFRNLLLTIPTALAFTLIGYIVSLPTSFLIDSEATSWQLRFTRLGGIETQRLRDIGRFQVMVALSSTVLGTVVAQTTFIMYAIRNNQSSND